MRAAGPMVDWTASTMAEGAYRPPASAAAGGVETAAPEVAFGLSLFGNPRVVRRAHGREVEVEWRLRRALLTVAFLALAPDRRASKEELVEALWPEADRETVRRNFHPTVSWARRALAATGATEARVLPFAQGVYRLASEVSWEVDVWRFREAVESGRRARQQGAAQAALDAWLGAWRLYRGPLLAGYELPWVARRRERLHGAYLGLLGDVGDLCAEVGRDQEALDAYRSLLLEDPFEERVHLAVIELYGRRGRRDLARRQYLRLQEVLAELNVEPREETRRRFTELMG